MTTNRRDFFKIFGALPLAAALLRKAGAQPPVPRTGLLLNRFSIAGFPYYRGPVLLHNLKPIEEYFDHLQPDEKQARRDHRTGAWGVNSGRLKPGARLKLTREPGNSHDPFAVEIHMGGDKLGYVPRSDNKPISRLLRQGASLACWVIDVEKKEGVWGRVRVGVWLV